MSGLTGIITVITAENIFMFVFVCFSNEKRNGSQVRTYRIARDAWEVSALANNPMLMLDDFCIIWSVEPRVEYILLSFWKMKHFSMNFVSFGFNQLSTQSQRSTDTWRRASLFEKSHLLNEPRGDVVLGLEWKASFLANSSQDFKSLRPTIRRLLINPWAYL